MKVLHVYRRYYPESFGGIEESIRQTIFNTSEQTTSRVLTLSANTNQIQQIELDGHLIYQIPQLFEISSCSIALKGLSLFPSLCKWADIIHYHFPWPFADVLHFLFKHSRSKKTVVSYHSDIIRQKLLFQLYKPLMRLFLNSVNNIIVSTENYLDSSAVLAKYRKKVQVIPIGLSKQSYPKCEDIRIRYWQERLGYHFFLFIGVLRYYKGLEVLLESAKNAPYKIVIAGTGPIESELKLKAENMQLDNVIFLGQISNVDKIALLQLAIGFVFPSYLRSESFGISLLEAAMFKRALITTDIDSGMKHINHNQVTGFVVKPYDPKQLRHAMDVLYRCPELAKKFGLAAKTRYENFFSGKQMGTMINRLYQKLLAK